MKVKAIQVYYDREKKDFIRVGKQFIVSKERGSELIGKNLVVEVKGGTKSTSKTKNKTE